MKEAYFIMPLFLWLFTCGIIFYFDKRLRKKVGSQSDGYACSRLPRFLALLLNSIASIAIIAYIGLKTVTPEASTYFAVPYFGIVAYYLTCFFRTIKDERNP